MKTVNKIILLSCGFCYFAGLYLLAVKLGILRLISQWGLHRIIKEWPEDFPPLTVIFICLALYTLFFILITYWIYKANNRHARQTDLLQNQSQQHLQQTERLSLLISQYKRICRINDISPKELEQRLVLLQRQVASLPSSAYSEASTKSQINQFLEDFENGLETFEQEITMHHASTYSKELRKIVEEGIDTIQQIRSRQTINR